MEIEEEKTTPSHLLSDEIKYKIIFYKKEGSLSNKDIDKLILAEFGRKLGHSTVQNVWKKFLETEQVSNQWSTMGRPKALNEEEREMLIETARDNRLSSTRELLEEVKFGISRETANRELLAKGYKAYKAPAKPLLTEDNIAARYQYARRHRYWKEDRWRTFVFTDENCFRLVHHNGRVFVRRLPEEELNPNVIQHSVASKSMVMVWGAVSREGIGPLVRVKGNMDGNGYLDLFRFRLKRYYPDLYNGNQIFLDDNAPPHNSNVVSEWFNKFGIQRTLWPANSPDLNIIEDVWNKMKYEIREKIFTSKDELWEELKYQWQAISKDFIDCLYDSLPNRIQAVLEAEGGSTKY